MRTLSSTALALATLAALGLGVARPAAAQTNLVTNGSFEAGGAVNNYIQASPGNTTTIPGWTVDPGSDLGDTHGVVLTGTYWQAASGTNSVELNNDTGNYGPGGIYQDITVTPGRSYTLTFSGSGQPNAGPDVKQTQVFWYNPTAAPGTASGTFTFNRSGFSQTNMGWTAEGPLTLTATAGTMRLRFVGTVPSNDDGGFAIDNVSLIAAAPEPSQYAAFTIGLLGLGALALKARKRADA